MKKNFIAATALLVLFTSTHAQEKSTPSTKKKEVIEKEVVEKKKEKEGKKNTSKKITLKKNVDGKEEKTIIVVENDKVTVNGKPVEELNDTEMEVLVENGESLGDIAPRIKINRSLGKLRQIAPEIIKEFRMNTGVNKAILGVSSKTVSEGAEIISVNKESAAEKAGLKEGDIITKINDKTISKDYNLHKAIGLYKPNDKITISYKRDGKENTTEVILDKNDDKLSRVIEMDANGFMEMPFEEMGERFPFVEGLPLNEGRVFNYRGLRPKLGVKIQDVEEGEGVKILTVEENTAAHKAGLQVGDVIVKMEDKEVKGVDDFRRQSATIKQGDTLTVTVNRNGKREVITIKFPKKLKTAEL